MRTNSEGCAVVDLKQSLLEAAAVVDHVANVMKLDLSHIASIAAAVVAILSVEAASSADAKSTVDNMKDLIDKQFTHYVEAKALYKASLS